METALAWNFIIAVSIKKSFSAAYKKISEMKVFLDYSRLVELGNLTKQQGHYIEFSPPPIQICNKFPGRYSNLLYVLVTSIQ